MALQGGDHGQTTGDFDGDADEIYYDENDEDYGGDEYYD